MTITLKPTIIDASELTDQLVKEIESNPLLNTVMGWKFSFEYPGFCQFYKVS
jgi:hypothetical protein